MNIHLSPRRAALFLGFGSCLAFAGCTSDPAPATSPPGGGGAAAAGAPTVAGAGSAGAGATGGQVVVTAGAGGSVGGGGAGMATGGGGSGGTGGVAGSSGSAGAAGSAGAPAMCPGASKALHFSDDINGTTTKSTQLTADLGSDLPIGNSARTIEMWLYMEGKESWKAEHSIIEYGGTDRCQAFGIDGGDGNNNGDPQFDPFTFSAGGPCTGDDNLTLMPVPPRTGWLHLAWVYDPTGKLAYLGTTNSNFLFTINGVPQPIPDKVQTGTLLTMKTAVVIGAGQGTDNGFTGKMEELRIWNVARTPTQISDNYKVILKGDDAGLVAYYHFDDGTGMTAKDSSSKHHDATFATDGGRPAPTWVDSSDLMLTCAP
jgi:hypothetical protein